MKLYSYFTVDNVIIESVKMSAGSPFLIPWENEKKGYKMDFLHFDKITEPVDSPVERLKNLNGLALKILLLIKFLINPSLNDRYFFLNSSKVKLTLWFCPILHVLI